MLKGCTGMIKLVEKEHCSGCTACMACCPKEAISMCADEEGFKYPVIDRNQCVECEKCVRTCPVTNKQKKNPVVACINKVTIASGVLIAGNVLIEDHFHGDVSSSEADIEPNKRILKSRGEISIGENVWIGENVVIMPGVSIGRGCVIGANSTVTKSIPDYAVAAGSPAKIIRRLKN